MRCMSAHYDAKTRRECTTTQPIWAYFFKIIVQKYKKNSVRASFFCIIYHFLIFFPVKVSFSYFFACTLFLPNLLFFARFEPYKSRQNEQIITQPVYVFQLHFRRALRPFVRSSIRPYHRPFCPAANGSTYLATGHSFSSGRQNECPRLRQLGLHGINPCLQLLHIFDCNPDARSTTQRCAQIKQFVLHPGQLFVHGN